MSRLSDDQWTFEQNKAKLILFAAKKGFKLTGGEHKRPMAMQYLYYYGKDIEVVDDTPVLVDAPKRSKTLESDHLHALAEDFNIFYDIDGDGDQDYNPPKEISQILGEYWKGLDPRNYWGGDWGWDCPHFGMKRK